MKNQLIRNAMEKYGIKQKDLAVILGTQESKLSNQLERNLAQNEQRDIVKAIKEAVERR